MHDKSILISVQATSPTTSRMEVAKHYVLLCAFIFHTQNNVVEAEMMAIIPGVVYAFHPEDGYHSMFVVSNEGVIAVDPVNTNHSKELLAAIKSVTAQPVKYLIYSHNHLDHTSGGQVFKDENVTIVAHAEAIEWMKANRHEQQVMPDMSWDGNFHLLTLGNVSMELHYFGMSHGRGMTICLLPDQKVAYVADLVTPNRVMFSIVPDFNIKEWLRTLGQIMTLNFDKVIFSHNSKVTGAIDGGTKADVQNMIDYINDLKKEIIDMLNRGVYWANIPRQISLPKYKDWQFYDKWLYMNTWRMFLDLWMGPYPWRPRNERPGKTTDC